MSSSSLSSNVSKIIPIERFRVPKQKGKKKKQQTNKKPNKATNKQKPKKQTKNKNKTNK